MIYKVEISKPVQKDLAYVPRHIVIKLLAWVQDVETQGIEGVRKRPGYHDEPLKGKRDGERSIRLSKAYRAIYEIVRYEGTTSILVTEVTKHEY